MKNDSLTEITHKILENHTFIIASHKNPDGDTIGSNFALSEALNINGKYAISYCEHKIPENFNFLKNENIKFIDDLNQINGENFDVLICVDASDPNRFTEFEKIKKISKLIINIDHHKTNNFFGNYNYVDLKASATAEIIYDLLCNLKFEITKNIAKSIYTGIITDTGSFRYSNTTPKAFKISAKLLQTGIDAWEISEYIYENQPLRKIKLLTEALQTLQLIANDKIALMSVSKEMLAKYNATYEDTDGFVNYGRSIKGVELSIFIREEENGCKLSFRSKGNIDASKLAEMFGGGGHFNAAGAFIEKPLNEALKIIYNFNYERYFSQI